MTITPEREREIEARCAAATAGPWIVCPHGNEHPFSVLEDNDPGHNIGVCLVGNLKEATANAAFIAHARQDVEDLLSSYKAMREALVKIRDGAWVEQDGSVSDAALDIQHLAKLALQPFTKPAQSKEPGA
jgi:hypothetical protein